MAAFESQNRAIPLKTAFAAERLRLPTILDLATAMGRCVTIKREAHIKWGSKLPHNARFCLWKTRKVLRRKGFRVWIGNCIICRASLREMGADLYDRKVVLWLHG
nr:MAG TPA: hypothetical protein [Caudoviricetes sp.]